MDTTKKKFKRVSCEEIPLVEYNHDWPLSFKEEKIHLLSCLPENMIGRIEHVGSTAVPGLTAKPIIDMLVEVASAEESKKKIAPILETQGYDYFWRPLPGRPASPFYAWFIKRNDSGQRTHHIHMVEYDFEHWDCILFRDYLIEHPDIARDYVALKQKLAGTYPNDREAYTVGKSDFIERITRIAKKEACLTT